MTGVKGILELQVLAALKNYKFYLKYADSLQPEFFKTTETRLIYKCIDKLHRKFKKTSVTSKQIWLLLESYLDPDDYKLYKNLLIKIQNQVLEDVDIIDYTVVRFLKENMFKREMSNVINQLGMGNELDFDSLKIQLDKINAIEGKAKDVDYSYFDMHKDRTDPGKEPKRFATGISKELDLALSGGVAAGELAFFLAPTGRGKTLALVNIGANALKQGKKVLHVTMEIKARSVAKRYDTCLTECTFNELKESPKLLVQKLEKISKLGGKLIIRDYSYRHFGVSQLTAALETYKDKKELPDLVIIDYADLMLPKHISESRHEYNRLYEELRVIAGQYSIPVWTASQSNRASLNKRIVTMADIAEAFGKTNTADLIIALCQTEDEKTDREMRLFVAKQRMGETNPIITVHCDLSRMILRAIKEYDKEGIWDRPRLTTLRNSLGKNNAQRK